MKVPYKYSKDEKAYQDKNRKKISAYKKLYYKKYKKELLAEQKDWYIFNKEKILLKQRAYYKRTKKERTKYEASRAKDKERYYKNNKNKIAARSHAWYLSHIELATVRSHHNFIFGINVRGHKHYKGMPFFDAWNPDKGGLHQVAVDWIIENLGKRPVGTSLHIVDHSLGFVPGNLEWTHPQKQNHQQMRKIIVQQRNKIKKLETHIKELKNL